MAKLDSGENYTAKKSQDFKKWNWGFSS